MHILHKWSKWKDGTATSVWRNILTGATGATQEVEVQIRECLVCGKKQVRRLND